MTEIPFVSQGADLISGGISLATGDYVGAALSVGSLLPGIGQVTGAAKMARRTTKIAPKLLEVTAKGAKKVDAAADAKLLKYNNVKASEKVIDDMSATGKKVDAPKKNISKKSEIDAKTTKKENVKEREVVEKDPSDGSKLDVHEYTYPWEGNRANPNEFTDPYPKNIAKDRDLGPFEHLKKDVADKKVSQNLQSKNSGLIKQNKYWGTNIGSNSGISKINPYPKPNFGL